MSTVLTRLPERAEIERMVFAADPWADSYRAQTPSRIIAVREALARHMESCAPFRAYCDRCRFSIEQVQSEADLVRIPQIPVGAFKRSPPISVPASEVVLQTRSSGTQGAVSHVARDARTLDMLLGSLQTAFHLVGDMKEHEASVLHLGPSPEDSSRIWMSYVMGLVELAYETHHYAGPVGLLDLDAVLEGIAGILTSGRRAVLLGAPISVKELAELAQSRGLAIRSGENLTVITGGGWKRRSGEQMLRPHFNALVAEAFGLRSVDQIRDGFNQVELNTTLLECEFGRKHVPPWLSVIVRDLETLAPVGSPEQIGLLSFLDPTATSFPCFIAGNDVGNLSYEACDCGRDTPSLHIHRRLAASDSRGCALSIEAETQLFSKD